MEEQVIEILKKYNQEHIIEHMKNLDENKKQKLMEQVENIDFEELEELYTNTRKT